MRKYFKWNNTCQDSEIESEFDLKINCGSDNLRNIENVKKIQRRKVKNVFFHPEYDEKSLINDMAVILVDQDFDFTDSVNPVCLPDKEFADKVSSSLSHSHDPKHK